MTFQCYDLQPLRHSLSLATTRTLCTRPQNSHLFKRRTKCRLNLSRASKLYFFSYPRNIHIRASICSNRVSCGEHQTVCRLSVSISVQGISQNLHWQVVQRWNRRQWYGESCSTYGRDKTTEFWRFPSYLIAAYLRMVSCLVYLSIEYGSNISLQKSVDFQPTNGIVFQEIQSFIITLLKA
jgi:hypothetical protein